MRHPPDDGPPRREVEAAHGSSCSSKATPGEDQIRPQKRSRLEGTGATAAIKEAARQTATKRTQEEVATGARRSHEDAHTWRPNKRCRRKAAQQQDAHASHAIATPGNGAPWGKGSSVPEPLAVEQFHLPSADPPVTHVLPEGEADWDSWLPTSKQQHPDNWLQQRLDRRVQEASRQVPTRITSKTHRQLTREQQQLIEQRKQEAVARRLRKKQPQQLTQQQIQSIELRRQEAVTRRLRKKQPPQLSEQQVQMIEERRQQAISRSVPEQQPEQQTNKRTKHNLDRSDDDADPEQYEELEEPDGWPPWEEPTVDAAAAPAASLGKARRKIQRQFVPDLLLNRRAMASRSARTKARRKAATRQLVTASPAAQLELLRGLWQSGPVDVEHWQQLIPQMRDAMLQAMPRASAATSCGGIHPSHRLLKRGILFWCKACGHFTAGGAVRKLAKQCARHPNNAGKQNLRALAKGRTPQPFKNWQQLRG